MHVRRLTLPPIASLHQIEIDEAKSRFLKKVNQYLLLSKIGQGANCKVLLGLDVITNKHYAVKVFRDDMRHRLRSKAILPLEREVRIMRMIDHENIVKLHEVLHAPQKDASYLIMEFGNCGSLKKYIDSSVISLSEKTLATVFKQIIKGLAYLHGRGFVHQDIKPSNILIFSDGTVKIGDFGIGHSFQSAETVVGSPAYQAPEVFEDEPDENGDVKELDPAKKDVWSLGVTLYECVFKKLPFEGENVYEIARCIRQNGLILTHDVSNELKDLLFGMLNVDSEARYTIQQIQEHQFFKQAEERFVPTLPAIEIPKTDPNISIIQIPANVCDSTYSFTTMHLSNSWSGMIGRPN